MITVIIGIVVVIVIVCAIAGIYNNMVTKRNRIDNAWQNIDTQLQRRNDLIPNLVETVKGYAKHEQETLSAVISARNTAVKATTPEAKMEADNVLTGALRQLFAVAEAIPILRQTPTLRSCRHRSRIPRTRLAMHARATTTAYSATTTPFRRSRLSSLPASSSLRSARLRGRRSSPPGPDRQVLVVWQRILNRPNV